MPIHGIDPQCSIALKEWAVICAALSRGTQSILLRKGGIDEGPAGFRPEHRLFWLLPTAYHQSPDSLQSDAHQLLTSTRRDFRPGEIRIDHLAAVDEVYHLEREEDLDKLHGLHIWSDETVHQRFHYRAPGLFVMLLRLHRIISPAVLPEWPELAGCRSWVQLPGPLSTADAAPVLSDEAWSAAAEAVRQRLR